MRDEPAKGNSEPPNVYKRRSNILYRSNDDRKNNEPLEQEGKQMSEEKQIEEMARFVCSSFHGHHDCENCSLYEERCCVSFCAAKRLYNAGYRKQSEGEWTERIEPLSWCEDDVDIFYECSCCGTHNFGKSPYCPNCGAKMKGGAE
jgi:hypothetical protein